MHVCVGSWVCVYIKLPQTDHWVSSNSTVASADTTGYIYRQKPGYGYYFLRILTPGAVAATEYYYYC
jgi:hypothetical protein